VNRRTATRSMMALAGRASTMARAPLALTVCAALTVLAAAAGCGASSNPPSPGGTGTGTTDSSTKDAASNGPSGTLKLTGLYTYDGPFTGMFVCHYDDSGYFALEGQEPYLMNITVQKMREGTFVLHPQDPATGFSKADPGQPVMDVRRLDKIGDPEEDVLLRQNGGTLTFVDGGTSGTLSADYINDFGDKHETVHAELHWTNCVH